MTPAVAYMRTSSATNVGADKDSVPRQRAAIESYAGEAGFAIDPADWFYDPAVKGEDSVTDRPGFVAMLARLAQCETRVVLVESPDRFARDLVIQLTGHDHLKALGVDLIPASAPDYFTEDTPTAVLVRQVLGAIAQFEKANLVAKLKAARDRRRALLGKCGGRKAYSETKPELVQLARDLAHMPLRAISAHLAGQGFLTATGKPYSTSAVRSMIKPDSRDSRITGADSNGQEIKANHPVFPASA